MEYLVRFGLQWIRCPGPPEFRKTELHHRNFYSSLLLYSLPLLLSFHNGLPSCQLYHLFLVTSCPLLCPGVFPSCPCWISLVYLTCVRYFRSFPIYSPFLYSCTLFLCLFSFYLYLHSSISDSESRIQFSRTFGIYISVLYLQQGMIPSPFPLTI